MPEPTAPDAIERGEALIDASLQRDLTPGEHALAAAQWMRRADALWGVTRRGRQRVGLHLARAQAHATLATLATANHVADLVRLVDSDRVAQRVADEDAAAAARDLAEAIAYADAEPTEAGRVETGPAGPVKHDEADRLARLANAGYSGCDAILDAVMALWPPASGPPGTTAHWDRRVFEDAHRRLVADWGDSNAPADVERLRAAAEPVVIYVDEQDGACP